MFPAMAEPGPPRHSTRSILLFWMPLAATWLMMAAEGPFLAAIIARQFFSGLDPTAVDSMADLLREADVGGEVLLWFFIDEEGRVQRTQINTSSGYDAFDQDAAASERIEQGEDIAEIIRNVLGCQVQAASGIECRKLRQRSAEPYAPPRMVQQILLRCREGRGIGQLEEAARHVERQVLGLDIDVGGIERLRRKYQGNHVGG